MTCKDFSGMIPDFFNDRLDNASLKAFLDHHRTCKGCREELEIQYLVGRAFEQMEAGEEVNLAKDLPDYIEKEEHRLEGRARIVSGKMKICRDLSPGFAGRNEYVER